MNPELFYQLALSMVSNIGDVHAKILVKVFGQASEIFKASQSVLEQIEGIGPVRARAIRNFNSFHLVERELEFMKRNGVRSLFLTDPDYPQRLLHCYDSPTLLFYKGEANLNASRVLSIVGTRNHTDYGRLFTEKLVRELQDQNILIISGLAWGIDALAHKAALRHNLLTVGVVGHGLDTIYPFENAQLANDMLRHGGGILTEFCSETNPEKHNFPLRNRIVAGLSDAVVIVETDIKGGSIITAKLADAYNRDVFAAPGRTIDRKSNGCNHLIKYNKAQLLTDAQELLDIMGWSEKKPKKKKQRELFIELSAEEQKIVQLLQERETIHIDEINLYSGLSSSSIAAAILNLEIQGIVSALPGKMYRLVSFIALLLFK
jgi:DNA processing protein